MTYLQRKNSPRAQHEFRRQHRRSSQVEELLTAEEQSSNNEVDDLYEFVFGKESETAVEIPSRVITKMNDAEVEERNQARIPLNTKKSTAWAVRTWDDWAKERNRLP
ncbi:hypothetical protein AC249_AIPGENE8774 [Exaiptasia diaphana]|nr:hypothetical protein AC249_AIPGENE8774 [Exaiptasia diaphana]